MFEEVDERNQQVHQSNRFELISVTIGTTTVVGGDGFFGQGREQLNVGGRRGSVDTWKIVRSTNSYSYRYSTGTPVSHTHVHVFPSYIIYVCIYLCTHVCAHMYHRNVLSSLLHIYITYIHTCLNYKN